MIIILSLCIVFFSRKELRPQIHAASSLKPLSHMYMEYTHYSPFSNECLKLLPLYHKSNMTKKCSLSQPLESSQLDVIKLKRVLQIVMYTMKITIVFFLGNGNHIIIFLSWQLLVFILLVMQKYSKRSCSICLHISFLEQQDAQRRIRGLVCLGNVALK